MNIHGATRFEEVIMAIVPLSDASRQPVRFPVVTAAIIVANVLVFALELLRGDQFVLRWATIPADIVAGRHWESLLTSMFMHGSWLHIISNMIFLWAFGPEIEDAMGRLRYLGFYLLGGLCASLSQIAAGPHSTMPELGASGAIAAVMGAFLVTYPRDRVRSLLVIFVFVNIAYIPAALLIGVWAITQFVNLGSIGEQPTEGMAVAYAAHAGGFIFGTVASRLFEAR
jgi:membrane associated rhomboid family serine protease